ncbi:hypothetical protein BMF77_02827 [Dolichospermum sp. UHCC 0315A]|uniref:hypothetical protein n=1 Tax=Dolichospermum sp. UHCC 0315A TaxID=1914871 RepID=UPI0011E77CCE|nr:hypothetical protein [Dolichospermum sp. UHCC 0315A]QEI42221.1 hypothetical protein BMF77_02827 [Dolichospermum sp. UHCC 0315A]
MTFFLVRLGNLAHTENQITTLAKDEGLVRQAIATLAEDQAQAKYAQSQTKRYNELYKNGAVSQDQAQLYSTNSETSQATLQADREAIQNAQAVVRGDKIAI